MGNAASSLVGSSGKSLRRRPAPLPATPLGKTILVVEDEPEIAELLKRYLVREGYGVAIVGTGLQALHSIRRAIPDLLILDLMLPELSGLEVCKQLRADSIDIPIVMLTAKSEESDLVVGLELGADDYVTKPFSPGVLVTRVKALLRRQGHQHTDSNCIEYGTVTMDVSRHEVRMSGREISLTTKEFGVLRQLLQHPGRVLTREILLQGAWGDQYEGTARTVDVHICRLKQKLPALETVIESVNAIGYRLKAPAATPSPQ